MFRFSLWICRPVALSQSLLELVVTILGEGCELVKRHTLYQFEYRFTVLIRIQLTDNKLQADRGVTGKAFSCLIAL